MKKIVVFGSINTDLTISSPYLPSNGETLKGSDFSISFGGKGANQSVAASRLGAEVQMIGCVGNDSFGLNALESLKRANVGTNHVRIVEAIPSAIAMIIRIENDNRIILDGGANEDLSADDLSIFITSHDVNNSIFITQLENNPIENIRAIKIAKKAKMITIFNPAPAIKVDDEIFEIIDYLIINQTEAKILSNIYPESYDECINVYRLLKQKGLKKLIITLGVSGSYFFTETDIQKIDSIRVNAVDSTGAGDAYVGAFAYSLANNKELKEACVFASYVAALSVMKKGAQSSLPTLDEVNVFIRSKENEK